MGIAKASLDKHRIKRWTLHTQLAGKMPTLPSEDATLRNAQLVDWALRTCCGGPAGRPTTH